MAVRWRSAVAAAAVSSWLVPCAASAEPALPPDIDCKMGFEAIRNSAAWLPNAKRTTDGARDVIVITEPEVWRVEIKFTAPGDPGHPAVVLRKFVKQVTGVWTAQSKACGYGNPADFVSLLAAAKAEDSRLTNASRAEVERQKREQSPLGAQ
jgi:hypothetical protein